MVPAGEETISAKHFDDLSSGERRRLVVRAVLRTIVTVALVVTIYFLIPMDHATDAGDRGGAGARTGGLRRRRRMAASPNHAVWVPKRSCR